MNDSNVISQLKRSDQIFLWLSLMAVLCLLFLRELRHMTVYPWNYVQSPENWLHLLMIIAAFISCSGVVDCRKIKLHSSVVALLLGWSGLLLMSGRLPHLSAHLAILRTVALTFFKVMASYAPLLIALALSFYILFRGSSEQGVADKFDSPLALLEKTIDTSSGELEISHLYFYNVPYRSHVIYLLFAFLVSVVILNVLSALAAGDTSVVRKNAGTLVLVTRSKLVSRIERLVNALPKCMKTFVELEEEMFVIYPNRRNRIGSAAVQSLLGIISEKTKPEGKEKMTTFQNEWRMFKEKLSELQILQEKLQKKLIQCWMNSGIFRYHYRLVKAIGNVR